MDDLVLVTGATGYVGGRLVPCLLEAGYRVRCLVRDPGRLQGRSWVNQVEVVQGDVLASEGLREALHGVTVAYYLVHSMSRAPDFYRRDLLAADNFAQAARDAGVQRIIYLGGLGDPATNLSPHLRSRQETGRVLCSHGVPVTEFRAAIIVGAGSASFEMIRYLTERLPIMICPRWVYTRVQPISIDEVLQYLVDALRTPESVGRILEIGGADVLTYGDMMLGYARVRGLRRYLIPVPVLTPRLSSYWVHWVTPIPADIARPLIEGLRNEVVVRDDTARRLFPHIEPVDYLTAVRRALASLHAGEVETAWSDALVNSCGDVAPVVLETREGMIIEQRRLSVQATPEAVYHAFASLGGERGWLYADWAWHLRGAVDRLIGGVGLRRGRRHPYEVRPGDALDFWRVEAVEPGRLLRLRAEMKLPGDAWLQYEALPQSDGRTLLVQTAFFAPKGLLGFLYWYGLLPVHQLIFAGLLRSVARLAQEYAQQTAHKHRDHCQTG
ncbi:MAG: SDR family oxidoreductase [Anaerolineae bacterium]|nr:SDR family oxidoreductase [Anaerolineae bacterium]MDW8070130.1 SDR family oxidoreductase [Anaerolineae bacterium]